MKSKDRKNLSTMLLLGQSALNLAKPKRRGPYWRAEEQAYHNVMHRLNKRPSTLKSLLAVVGAGLGARWLWQQFKAPAKSANKW
jgi:hypothetical protein